MTPEQQEIRVAMATAYEQGYADGLRRSAEGDDGPRFVNPYEEGR